MSKDEKEILEEEQHNNEHKQEEAEEQKQEVKVEDSFRIKFLKLSADLENFRRRVTKERSEWMQLAQVDILKDLLPIFDELERAIELGQEQETAETKSWVDGLKLIQKNWKKKFKQLKVKQIATDGTFDPEQHEALMQVEDDSKKSGQIVQTLHKGYTFQDKVVVHAKVSVAK